MARQIPEIPRFPTETNIPFVQRPARLAWQAVSGEVITADLPCGRDLTSIDGAMLYIFSSVVGGLPTVVNCSIANPAAGVVHVEYDTSSTPAGDWRWTLFLIAPMQPIPAYTGTVRITST
jgi:hypothetical protein